MISYMVPDKSDFDGKYISGFTSIGDMSLTSELGSNLSFLEKDNKPCYFSNNATLAINTPSNTNLNIGFWIRLERGGEFSLYSNEETICSGKRINDSTVNFFKPAVSGVSGSLTGFLGIGWNLIVYRAGSLYAFNETGKVRKTTTHSLNNLQTSKLFLSFQKGYLSSVFVTENILLDSDLEVFEETLLKFYDKVNEGSEVFLTRLKNNTFDNSFKLEDNGRVTSMSFREYLELDGDGRIRVKMVKVPVYKLVGKSLEDSIKYNFPVNEMFCVNYNGSHVFYGERENNTLEVDGESVEMIVGNLTASGLEQFMLLNGNKTRAERITYFNNKYSSIKNSTTEETIIAEENIDPDGDIQLINTDGSKTVNSNVIPFVNGVALVANKFTFIPKEMK